MSQSTTTPRETADTYTVGTTVELVELEMTVGDQFFYPSREVGDTAKVLPYMLHTGLYYALGFLPSRFRTLTDQPKYEEHYRDSDIAQSIYIHPATPLTTPETTTRRISCNGDTYRVDNADPDNKNLQEISKQEYLNPGSTLRTFLRINPQSEFTAQDIADQIQTNIRIGKKMTSTRTETYIHSADVEHGEFTLGQPIAGRDFKKSDYSNYKDIERTSLNNMVITDRCVMTGDYMTVEPVKTPVDGMDETVELPVHTSFLGC